jgi:hypothetical protein
VIDQCYLFEMVLPAQAQNSAWSLLAAPGSISCTRCWVQWQMKVSTVCCSCGFLGLGTPCMQRKDGRPARGCTSEEFRVVAKAILDEARRKFKQHGIKTRPVLSMDNDSVHTSAKLAAVGVDSRVLLPLPPHSPDLHRVIERVMGASVGRS